ncbi:hypothetical protein GF385_02210, partial [Candidatus Dependentiae bacterium]|nr:hypothetical protein [Candidatus Dependentiae bacterium]
MKNNYKNSAINFSDKKRLEIIKKNFTKKFNLEFNKKELPIVSVCSSGGGFRSMLATLGALEGLHNLNLLDSVFNISSLSGSAWGVMSWILSGKNIIEFNRNFSKKLNDFYSLKKVSKINFNKLKSYKSFLKSFYYLALK